MDTEPTPATSPVRAGAMTGLAIIGFIALIALGLWLAVYAARYVPEVADGLGAAVFTSDADNAEPDLTVVPTATSTLPFSDGSVVQPTSTTTTNSEPGTQTPSTYATPVTTTPAQAPVYYRTVETTYPTTGSTAVVVPTTYSGLADLTVSIIDVGYLDSRGRFVVDRTVRDNQELAAEILVVNTGTNKTGSWEIKVTFPTKGDRTFTKTERMRSLEPNQPLPITISLSRGDPRTGTNRITVEVDPDDDINESSERNNKDSASVTVR